MWSATSDPVRQPSGTWHVPYGGLRGDVWDIVLRVADGQEADRAWTCQLRTAPDAADPVVASFTMATGAAFVDTDGATKRDLTFTLVTDGVVDPFVTYYGDVQYVLTAGSVGPYTVLTFTGLATYDTTRP